jgi:hypothetical protein
MPITEEIQISANKTKFTLFKEGLFYKCYNEDASVFTEKINKYKVNAKYIKSVGAAVLSLGFPVSVIAMSTITFEAIAVAIDAPSYFENTDAVVFELKNKDLQNYASFKEAILACVNEFPVALNVQIESLSKQLAAWQKYNAGAHANE